MLVTLGAAVLASGAALAAVLAASRAAERHARAENRRLQEFGAALIQVAHELAALAASQSAAVQQAQAHSTTAGAASAKAAAVVAEAETRLNRFIQRAEQSLATAGDSLHRAQEGLAPLSGLAQDLPGAIGTAIRDAAQSGAQEAAAVIARIEAASRLLEHAAHALPDPAAIAASLAAATETWPEIATTLQHAAEALRQQAGNAEELIAKAASVLPALAEEAVAAIAALRQERAALAADRRQNEHIASLLLRLGQQAQATAHHQPRPEPEAAGTLAAFTASLDQQLQPHFAAMRLLDERLSAAGQVLNSTALGAVRHELAATAADRAVRAQADATFETMRALQHALRFLENALGRAARAAPVQDRANQRVLEATQTAIAATQAPHQEHTPKESTSF